MTVSFPVDQETAKLTHAIAGYLGSNPERVLKMAVALLAVDCGLRFELQRKEKQDAG